LTASGRALPISQSAGRSTPLPDGLVTSRILRQGPVSLTVDELCFAIFYTKFHESTSAPTARDQSPAPPRSRKELRTTEITPLNRSTRQLEGVVGTHLARFGERDELTVRWELDPAASTPPDSQ